MYPDILNRLSKYGHLKIVQTNNFKVTSRIIVKSADNFFKISYNSIALNIYVTYTNPNRQHYIM